MLPFDAKLHRTSKFVLGEKTLQQQKELRIEGTAMEIKITKSSESDTDSCRCTKRLKNKQLQPAVWGYPYGKLSADKHLGSLCNDIVIFVLSSVPTKYKHALKQG